MDKVFDSHVHLGVWVRNEVAGKFIKPFGNRELKDYEDARLFMKINGITKAIFMPYNKSNQISSYNDNFLVLDVISKLEHAYGALYLNPEYNYTELLKEHIGLVRDKVVAFKINPDAWARGVTPDPRTWSKGFKDNMELIIETAKNNHLMIQFHTGRGNSDPLEYEHFINEYGDELRIQFVHMGGSERGHFKFVPRFIEWLKSDYDFYCDTSYSSGFAPYWLINKLMTEYSKGLKHVFFASNHPWGMFRSEYEQVASIDLPLDVKQMILYENANKVYS